jgi:hypothetical protein
MEQERRRGTLQIKWRALRDARETSDVGINLKYSLSVKTKQSRHDWGVFRTRLCS